MPFSVSWHTLLDEADDLPANATLVTPLSHKEFRIMDTQEHRVIIEYTDRDRDKVDDVLDVTDLSAEDVYEIDTTEYVRKAEIDENIKGTGLQGLKDRLAASDEGDEEVQELQEEIEELEDRIEELTSFNSGTAYRAESAW